MYSVLFALYHIWNVSVYDFSLCCAASEKPIHLCTLGFAKAGWGVTGCSGGCNGLRYFSYMCAVICGASWWWCWTKLPSPRLLLMSVEQVGFTYVCVGAVVYLEHVGVDVCGADWWWWTDQVFCTFVGVDVGSGASWCLVVVHCTTLLDRGNFASRLILMLLEQVGAWWWADSRKLLPGSREQMAHIPNSLSATPR